MAILSDGLIHEVLVGVWYVVWFLPLLSTIWLVYEVVTFLWLVLVSGRKEETVVAINVRPVRTVRKNSTVSTVATFSDEYKISLPEFED